MKKRILSMALGLLVLLVAFSMLLTTVMTKVSAESDGKIDVSSASAVEKLTSSPVYFEENRGQFNEKVRYFARGTAGHNLFLTGTDAVYVVREQTREKTRNPKAVAVYVSLVGANDNPASLGLQTLPNRTNYFKNDETNWRTEIPNHQSVRMFDVYDGIDVVWAGGNQGGANSDFLVGPNGDPNRIEWEVKGADAVGLDNEGNLVIRTEVGEIKRQRPNAYQNSDGFRQEIGSRFVLSESNAVDKSFRVKLVLGDFDRTKPLSIEPAANFSDISFSTFLGGTNSDEGAGIATDNSGNVYITGRTFSTDFPTTAGTIDTSQNGSVDVFVTALNAAGTTLIYSTYLGGTGNDIGFAIKVNAAGDAFITGSTESTTFPTTAGLDTTQNGLSDAFVTKLNATGSALTYSTFLGGNQGDDGRAIAIDSTGNAYVCGNTRSTNYPATAGSFDNVQNGSQDAFVTKINPTGTGVGYSTFIGGTLVDGCNGIAVDSTNSVFVTGATQSTGFPTVAGSFDTTHNGQNDVFVTKINAAGSALNYSTFIGGGLADVGLGIAVDSTGSAYVTGQTFTALFPTTVGAFNTTHNGGNGNSDVFVTKVNPAGTSLTYSTFLGGASTEIGNAIAVDAAGDAYVTGYTDGADFPTTVGAFDTTQNGSSDVFVTKFNAAGSTLTQSTFVGDVEWDEGAGLVIDQSGNALIAGRTQSPLYPTSPTAYDLTHNGGFDVFVTKLQLLGAVPGILQLSSATYGGSEGTTLIATADRVTGSDGTVGVTYALTDGTATGGAACTAGVDYINPGPQLLSFGDLVTSQPINVTLCTDAVTDVAETFTITLSTPTGSATLGTPTAATATIANVIPSFNGSYTVGSTGADYPSLTNSGGIFEAINTAGASGPVTINIITDLAGETGAVALNPIAGNPAVLIKPSGGPRLVSGVAIIAVIRINGADNITIDGSTAATVVGGTPALRELTVINLRVATNTAGISVGSTTESSNDVVIRNVNVSGAGPTQTLAGIAIGRGTVGSPALFSNNGIRIENCSIRRAAYGIYSVGLSIAEPNAGTVVTENDLSTTGANRIGLVGIYVANDNGALISQNSIGGLESSDTGDVIGIAAGANALNSGTAGTSFPVTNAVITRNRINGVKQDNALSAMGIVVAGVSGGTNTVANNMITGVISDGSNIDLPAGIFVAGVAGSTTRVFYNSVSMTGDRSALPTPSIAMNPGFAIAITGTDPNVELKNNIFYTTQTASTGGAAANSYAIGVASSTFANLDSNYNAFYSAGANDGGFRTTTLADVGGTDLATLANWQTATGGTATDDFNSAEGDPLFIDPFGNLHILTTTTLIVDKGTPVSILDDLDGQIRSLAGFAGGVPDIGADEAVVPTAASASVGGRIITANGLGIRNATVQISGGNLTQPISTRTRTFGYFSFDELEVGQTYVVTVSAKRFRFSNPNRVIALFDSVLDLDFVAEP